MTDILDRILADPLSDDAPFSTDAGPKKRSVRVGKKKTSIFLNDDYWNGLRQIAQDRSCSLDYLVTEIASRTPRNLSMTLRVFVKTERRNRGR